MAPASPGPADLLSSNAPRTDREVLGQGTGTPRTMANVMTIAQRMGIDLDELNGAQIRLGPASFTDAETLAATIAHEHTHVLQLRRGEHLERPMRELEDEAYASEAPALARFRSALP